MQEVYKDHSQAKSQRGINHAEILDGKAIASTNGVYAQGVFF